MRIVSAVLAAALLFAPSISRAGDPPGPAVFEELKRLAGTWKSSDTDDPTRVEIKLIAHGSALVETWTMSPARQSMTVYTLDGDRLLATHYCPQGNAPRLAFTRTDSSGSHHFLFVDGSNLRAVRELSQAFALAVPHEEAIRIRDDVAFFQAVQAVLAKRAPADARPEEEIDHAVRQIISRAVAPEGVVDIFAAAGLEKPDISILSDEFLAEVRGIPQRNLAVELLQKLLEGELKERRRKNVVQARSFAEMLEQTIRKYQNRAIEAAQEIEELIQLAKEMREANARGERLGLSEAELAFYDALETNDSAVKVFGDETLRGIARELVETVRNNVTIDWTLRENVRAQLRVLVKRILRKHGYPPDKQERAPQTVLEQAALLSAEWATA